MSFVLIVHGDHMGQKVQSPVLMVAKLYYCHVGSMKIFYPRAQKCSLFGGFGMQTSFYRSHFGQWKQRRGTRLKIMTHDIKYEPHLCHDNMTS